MDTNQFEVEPKVIGFISPVSDGYYLSSVNHYQTVLKNPDTIGKNLDYLKIEEDTSLLLSD